MKIVSRINTSSEGGLTLKFIYKLAEICIRTIALSRNFRLIRGVCAFYGFLKEPSRPGEREMPSSLKLFATYPNP